MLLSEGLGWGMDSCSLPSTLEALLASKFSTNWGWSPDLRTGWLPSDRGWPKRDEPTQAGSLAQRPSCSRAVAKYEEEVQLLAADKTIDTISTSLLISEWLPAR